MIEGEAMEAYVFGSKRIFWPAPGEKLREENSPGKKPAMLSGKPAPPFQSVPKLAEVLGIAIEQQMK